MSKNRTLAKTVALNLSRLMQERPELGSIYKIEKMGGPSKSTVQRLEAGDGQAKLETIESLADVFGIPVSALVRDPDTPDVTPDGNYVRLERLNVSAMGGYGSVVPDHIEVVQYLDVSEQFIRKYLGAVNPSRIKMLTGRGYSMTGFMDDGDVMFVEVTDHFTEDGIYVINIGGFERVKRLRLSSKERMLFVESNDGSEPERFSMEQIRDIHIQARFLGAWTFKKVR